MPQQPKKATVAQKLLGDERLRQSLEVSWKLKKTQTQSLADPRARCRALNDFVRKGLLADAEDDTSSSNNSRAQAGAPSGRKQSSTAKSTSPSTSLPLASRITPKESEALLQLLQFDIQADTTPYSSSSQTAGRESAEPGAASTSSREGTDNAAVAATTAVISPAGQDAASSTPGLAAQGGVPLLTGACTGQPAPSSSSSSSSDLLDDVIGLLNAPGVMPYNNSPAGCAECAPTAQQCLHSQQVQDSCPTSQCADIPSDTVLQPMQGPQQLQPRPPPQQQQKQQHHRQQLVPSLPPAVCREAHRQAWVRPPDAQQADLQTAALKHASINAAWQGFYSFWGPHAASVIQQAWRSHKARQQYLQLREAAVVLQAYCRGHLLRAAPENLLRVHREKQQQQLLQQQRAEQQRRQQQQQKEQERLRQELVLQQQECAAAVTLQCALRAWWARRLHAGLAASANAAAAAAAAGAATIVTAASGLSNGTTAPSTCSRGSDSSNSSCSRGSSRQSHSRGSTTCSLETPVLSSATAGPSSLTDDALPLSTISETWGPQAQQQQQQEWESLHEEQVPQCLLPELVIRSAAEKRTASHGAGVGQDLVEQAARQLVQRAGQLGVREGAQAAELATRTLLVSSSARQLRPAMDLVRSARVTK